MYTWTNINYEGTKNDLSYRIATRQSGELFLKESSLSTDTIWWIDVKQQQENNSPVANNTKHNKDVGNEQSMPMRLTLERSYLSLLPLTHLPPFLYCWHNWHHHRYCLTNTTHTTDTTTSSRRHRSSYQCNTTSTVNNIHYQYHPTNPTNTTGASTFTRRHHSPPTHHNNRIEHRELRIATSILHETKGEMSVDNCDSRRNMSFCNFEQRATHPTMEYKRLERSRRLIYGRLRPKRRAALHATVDSDSLRQIYGRRPWMVVDNSCDRICW